MATQIFKQLEHETLIDILNFQSASPVKDDISRKMAVKYLLEDITFHGVKNLIQALKLEELIKATSHLKIDHGTNNPKSKMVLSKRLKESFEEYGPSEWLNNCGDESVLKTFAQILGIKDALKLSAKALRPAIDNEIAVTGLLIFFENLNMPLLKKCCEEMEIENYDSVNSKAALVKAIVFDVPITAPEKKKKKVVKVGAKKPIGKCNEYEQLFQHYTLDQLVDWCKEKDVKTSGTKKVVINRILAYNDGDRENTMVDASNRSPKQSKKADTKAKPKKAKLPAKHSEDAKEKSDEEEESAEDVEATKEVEKPTKKKAPTKKTNKKNTKKADEDEEKSAEEDEPAEEVKEKGKKKGGKKAAGKDKKMKEKSAEEEEDNKSAEEEAAEEVKEKTKTKGKKKNDKKMKEKSAEEEEDNKSAEEEEVVEETKEKGKKKAAKKVAEKKMKEKEKEKSEEEEQEAEEVAAEEVEKKKGSKKAAVDKKKKETKVVEEDSNEEEEKETKKAEKKSKEISEEAKEASENEASETLDIEAAIAAERKLRTTSVEPSESVTSEEEDPEHPRNITGVHFAINGQLSLKQDVVKSAIEKAGGIVCSQLTKKVNVLVTNMDTSSQKFDKARSAGIKIVPEEYLVHILAPYKN